MRLAGLAAAAALAALPGAAAAQDVPIVLAPAEVLLNVQAEGAHLARPDMMSITAGIITTGRTAKEALAANNAQADRLLEAVRRNGIEARDIQTSELSVSPQFARDVAGADEEDSVRRIIGYMARNRLHLKLRDLRAAPDIVSALFEAGANEVSGPDFGFSDETDVRRAARHAAVAEARAEADTYAAALGMRVARVLRVSERGSFERDEGNTITVTGSRIGGTPLEPGEIPTTVEVWIDYALVPR